MASSEHDPDRGGRGEAGFGNGQVLGAQDAQLDESLASSNEPVTQKSNDPSEDSSKEQDQVSYPQPEPHLPHMETSLYSVDEPSDRIPTDSTPKARQRKQYTSAWTTEDLKPYEKYPLLYKERKNSRCLIRQTLSFTDDLPAEIRLMVYHYCPQVADDKLLIFFGDFIERTSPVFHMMRLCRKIDAELSSLMWGKPLEFRGSGGFCALGAFLCALRPENHSYLRHIVVDAPVFDPVILEKSVRHFERRHRVALPQFLTDLKHKRQDLSNTILVFQQICNLLQHLRSLKRLDIRMSNDCWSHRYVSGRKYYDWRCNMQNFTIERIAGESHRGGEAMALTCRCTDFSILEQFNYKDQVEHIRQHLNTGFWDSIQQLKEVLKGLKVRMVVDRDGFEFSKQLSRIRETNAPLNSDDLQVEFCYTVWMLRKGESLGWELGYQDDDRSSSKLNVKPFQLPFLEPSEAVWIWYGQPVLRTFSGQQQSPYSPFINIKTLFRPIDEESWDSEPFESTETIEDLYPQGLEAEAGIGTSLDGGR